MKKSRMTEAMNYLDDELVSWAEEYQRKAEPLPFGRTFRRVCACALVLLCIAGGLWLARDNSPAVKDPFTLTVYAESLDGDDLISYTLSEDCEVPISLVELENGQRGFYIDSEEMADIMPAYSVVTCLDGSSEEYSQIVDFEEDDFNYYFYALEASENGGYDASLNLPSEEGEVLYQYTISIREEDGKCYATLGDVRVLK